MEARTSINYEVIVVAGGDGTINEVVNGIVGATLVVAQNNRAGARPALLWV